ncbi:MAG: SDR family NAD(P)-dependent oxidoreductase [Bauldia sp.]|nr:SDR family NAD(P)-dependent oxidoreductase [Bauldia sp.]
MAVIDRPGVAWVTGASKGIGRALVLALAGRGWTVAASARSEVELADVVREAASNGRIVSFPLDVTDAAAVAAATAAIRDALGPIDLAVLNAGTHIPMAADAFDLPAFRTLVETNLMGAANCLAALLPDFMVRRAGEIAVVSSVSGYAGLPTTAGYGATKSGLITMCEALRPECELHDVSLRLICPGFVDTPLTRKNPFGMPFLVTADAAVAAILRGLAGRKFEIVFPWQMKLGMKLLRLLPYPLFFAVTRRITPAPKGAPPAA